MSRYLVTGGAGFIGSHLVDALLAAGHFVRVLDDLSTGKRQNVPSAAELIVGSVIDSRIVRQALADCDGCFHLAAIASVARCNEDWLASHQVNLGGTITVFEAARATASRGAIPVVYASSAAVYGANPDLPLSETSATNPISAYGVDKLGCELHAKVASSIHGVPTLGFRFFNVYGPRQDPASPYAGVISIFADRLRAGQPVTVYGDGEHTRDFIAIQDVVECLQRGMEAGFSGAEVLVACTGQQVSLRQLIGELGTILAVAPQISLAPAREGDIRHSLGNPAKLAERLGFTPGIAISEGLRALLVETNPRA
jgi:UDP-glucose 4-epimerase